jgi:Transposase DDE domain
VRCWCWPGNTADAALIRQAKTDMRAWRLARIVWVADRGFASAADRRFLQQGDGHYILGEKLRGGTPAAAAALARQGRYRTARDNLQVKEVKLDPDLADDRFVVCYNPAEAQRDAARRARHVAALTELIDGSDKLPPSKRDELARGDLHQATPQAVPAPHPQRPATHRPSRHQHRGQPRRQVPATHQRPNHVHRGHRAGYKQLLEVEHGWRTMKQVIDLRPVYHRKEDRIRAHVILCWLALLLIRIIETTTGRTWPTVRDELQRLQAITYTGPAGTFRQTTTLTKAHHDILAALGIEPPKKILDLAPPA